MNFIHRNLVAGAAFLLLGVVGCSTPQGTREDYFGYNNRPVIEEEEYTPPAEKPLPTKTWKNPLAESPRMAVVYYEPVFVPVTAPWWDRYYGWEDYHHSRVIVMYPHHRVRYYHWDHTYASYPYYDGYPYYGGYPYYDRPYHNYPPSRDIQPVEEKKTTRRFGSSRGTVNPETEKDTRGSDNDNWRVRRRGETTATPATEQTKETTSTPSRSGSNSSSTGTRSRGSSSSTTSKKEEKESSTSSTSTSKKSDSGSSKKSEPTTSTTKETKSKARGRGE